MASPAESGPPDKPFPVVGVGASAGGLKAFQELLTQMPASPGLAFVLIPHLDPKHESLLHEILARTAAMPIQEADNGTKIELNHVYVVRPNTSLTLVDGHLRMDAFTRGPAGANKCIDAFLVSLAQARGEHAVGIILSGSASDGAEGIRAIKREGGITFAQDDSAEFQGMPRAAQETGAVDYVLSPSDMARELLRIMRHPILVSPEAVSPRIDEKAFREILMLLEAKTGVPFLSYKSSTLERRILRRMALRDQATLSGYQKYLQDNPQEIRLLHDEVLVNFTTFFREPDTFEVLKALVFPKLLDNRPAQTPIRIWVPGCSTGEEAYSLAMSLVEYLDEKGSTIPIQIFASDVSEPSITVARAALYPKTIATDVSAERLRRFFAPAEGGGWQLNKRIRDLVLFARQDLTQDPPFSRLDILSCRNVLIYLGTTLHKRVLPLFHYALRSDGFLLLGPSETADRFPTLFQPVDTRHRIYQKLPGSRPQVELALDRYRGPVEDPHPLHLQTATPPFDFSRAVDRSLLTLFVPPGIVVTEEGQVLEVRGQVNPMIRVPAGRPNWGLQRLVHEELLADLENALRESRESGLPARRDGLQYRVDGILKQVNLCIVPVEGPTARDRHFAILFQTPENRVAPAPTVPLPDETQRELHRLRQTLSAQQDYQQTIIEKLESSNEELRSAHEEVLSANEELQSTNEELQTAKEELQSSNEELLTLNDELRSRNLELGQANDDLQNILASVQIPMVIVDPMLRVRRITPMAEKLLSVAPLDATRRIHEFKPALEVPNLEALLHSSIDNLSAIEQEVRDRDGRWWLLRIRPYRTSERRIDGAVLTLLDVDALKRSSIESEERRIFSGAVIQAMRDPLLVLSNSFEVRGTNEAYLKFFRVTQDEVEGRSFYDLSGGLWNVPGLRALLTDVLPRNAVVKDFHLEKELPGIGRKILLLNARQVRFESSAEPMILVTLEDVTERFAADAKIRDLNQGLERQVSERTSKLEGAKGDLEAFTYSVAHDLRAPLRAMHGLGQALIEDYSGKLLDATGRSYLDNILKASRKMDALIDDLLAFSRLGREDLRIDVVDLNGIVDQALEDQSADIRERKATVTVKGPLPKVCAHATTLRQVINNLISNAIKFVAPGKSPAVTVRAETHNDRVRVWVEDNGIGIAEHHRERIFQVFERLNRIEDYPGTGIGLAIVKRAVDRMHGLLGFESHVDKGSRFWIDLKKG